MIFAERIGGFMLACLWIIVFPFLFVYASRGDRLERERLKPQKPRGCDPCDYPDCRCWDSYK